ncbi:MAG: trigger factor, partial [Thermodesulfobacteriota bacterium]|nr:trigger factor [Thermodesulfobacteriota bacterium]
VEIDAQEVNKKLNEAYRGLGKRAKIPGFRQGKIPRQILEKRFGEQVMEDLTRDLIGETLPKAAEEANIIALTRPVIENEALKKDQNFNYSAVMEVRPDFELKDYLGLEIEKEICSVTDDNVNKQLEEILKNNGKLNSIKEDREAQEDDYLILEYEGFEDEQPIEGIKSDNFLLRIGSNDFHPDFERGLIGLKKGDTSEIKVSFEDSYYHPKLAGKTIQFSVKVMEIKEMELPELNDEFARSLGSDFNDLNDLKKKIKEEIIKREDTRIDLELKKRLLNKISESVEFELPESLVESEIRYNIENVRQNFLRAGSNMEKAGLKEEKLREEFRQVSERSVKEMLILGEIARQDNLNINEVELSKGFGEMAEKMGQEPHVVREYYEANQLVDSFKQKLLEEKTLNYLVKSAKVLEMAADQITGEGQ